MDSQPNHDDRQAGSALPALIVEDDERQARIFASALQHAGFATQVTFDGADALSWLQAETPAVIVLDLHLPQLSGREILNQIRTDPRLEKSRVILATADALLAEQLRNRAELVLLKPISFTQLRDLASRLYFAISHQD